MSRANSPLAGKVIFAVGARRSGTNWLQRVLSAHPSVVAVPSETYLFSHGLRPLAERFHQGGLSSSRTGVMYGRRDPVIDAMRDLCDVAFLGLIDGLDPNADRIVERTPDHVRHLDLIGEIYPDAHVVHIVRDGRDVVRSLLSHDWGPSDARAAADEWRTAIESARSAAPGLAHYHEVLYEEMLADPRPHIVKLFEAVGLSAGEHDLEPVLAEAGVGYNADPNAPSIEAGKWRTDLQPDILAVIEETAGEVLTSLGYGMSGGGVAGTAPFSPVASPVPPPARQRPTLRQRAGALRRKDVPVMRLAEQGQAIIDRFIGAAATNPRDVEPLLAPDVRVRIVDGDHRSDGRGAAARTRLVDELLADDVLRGPQALGFIHPAVPVVMFVGEFEHDGRRHPRVFALTISHGLIDRISYYRFPAR